MTKHTDDTSKAAPENSGAAGGQPWPKTEKAGREEAPTFTLTLSAANGPEQTPVFITGSGFGETAGLVTFNEVRGQVATWTNTGILTAVPYGATTGDLQVVTADGRRAATPFTVDSGVWTEQGVQGTLPKE